MIATLEKSKVETGDKYDVAIGYLNAFPDEDFDDAVYRAWSKPRESGNTAGCLFQIAARPTFYSSHTGCLTQIRTMEATIAETPELTEAIRADDRIPFGLDHITRKSLHVFAEWQRRLDVELERA